MTFFESWRNCVFPLEQKTPSYSPVSFFTTAGPHRLPSSKYIHCHIHIHTYTPTPAITMKAEFLFFFESIIFNKTIILLVNAFWSQIIKVIWSLGWLDTSPFIFPLEKEQSICDKARQLLNLDVLLGNRTLILRGCIIPPQITDYASQPPFSQLWPRTMDQSSAQWEGQWMMSNMAFERTWLR